MSQNSALFIITKAFANLEDAAMDKKDADTTKKMVRTDENVERVRRAHQNDLENIPLFLVTGFLYVLANPTVDSAKYHFYGFALSRIMHSIVYLNQVLVLNLISKKRSINFLGSSTRQSLDVFWRSCRNWLHACSIVINGLQSALKLQ